MSTVIELIAETIRAINTHAVTTCNNRAIIATPEALKGAQVAEVGGMTSSIVINLINAARSELLTADGSIIAGAAGKLKKLGVTLQTVKVTGIEGTVNALVFFETKQGMIVIWQHAGASQLLSDMLGWGIPPKIVEIEKSVEKIVEKEVEVIREVPAPIPQGFGARFKFLFG